MGIVGVALRGHPFVANSHNPEKCAWQPGAATEGRPYNRNWTQSIEEARIRIELRVGDVAFANWVHCDVVEVLLKVDVVVDNVVKEASLPKTLFEKVFRLNSRPVL